MSSLHVRLRTLGGIASVRELSATPSEQRSLARAAARGEVQRVRNGVYAVLDAHPQCVFAARIGGRLTGVSALAHHGLWVPPPHPNDHVHIEVKSSVVLRLEGEQRKAVRVHWVRKCASPQFGVAPLESVLACAANDLPLAYAVAVLDSALRATPLTPVELQLLAAGWRPKARAAAALADERSDSGTESVLRVLLLEAGIHATPQAPLPLGGHQRADLLVGDRLVIECDSEAHHAGSANRRADLQRDESLIALGFIVYRPDYHQVFDDPAGVVATVAAIVARGDHLTLTPTVRA